MSRVAVTGATGEIGAVLVGALRERGDTPVALSRNPAAAAEKLGTGVEVVGWPDPSAAAPPAEAVRGVDAVINLLGEPISQRWSDAAKTRIRDSRVVGTRNLISAIRALPAVERPKVLVSQSAVGFYGPRGDEEVDESTGPGNDFLCDVVKGWEAEALSAEADGLRVVLTRTGVVLTPQGGALEKMLPPFKAGVGGPIGGGRQYIPWIHVEDVVEGLLFCLDNASAAGPVNLTAPTPMTNKAFSKALGRALHRPAFAPVPGLAIKALYGEMAVIVLTGQRAVPKRLQELGYSFRHPDLEPALEDVLRG